MEILLISDVTTMLQEIKYRIDDILHPWWYETMSDGLKERFKYWALLFVLPAMSPITVFVHECGHAIVGILYGLEIREFVVELTGGKTTFLLDEVLKLSPLHIFLLFVIGGVAESLMYYALGRKVFRGFYVGILQTLPYGIWEGVKGLILLLEPSQDLVTMHTAMLEPLVVMSYLLGVAILSYKAYRKTEVDF